MCSHFLGGFYQGFHARHYWECDCKLYWKRLRVSPVCLDKRRLRRFRFLVCWKFRKFAASVTPSESNMVSEHLENFTRKNSQEKIFESGVRSARAIP